MAVENRGIPYNERAVNKNKGFNKKLLSLALGTAITIGGCGVLELMQKNQDSGSAGERPNPSEAGVIPSLEPTRSPEPTETPTPTPSPTPTDGFQTLKPDYTPPPPEAIKSKLEKNLDAWTSGQLKISKDKLFTNIENKKAPLNVAVVEHFENGDPVITYQGVFLGSESVDGHLIAYIGHKDKMGENYFVPLNLGKLDTKNIVIFYGRNDRYIHATVEKSADVDIDDTQNVLESRSKNDTLLYVTFPFKWDPKTARPNIDAQAYLDCVNLSKQYMEWSKAVTKKKSFKDPALLNKYPMVKSMINKRVTKFDKNKTLYVGQIYSAGLNLWNELS
jgi:hypothetical protein